MQRNYSSKGTQTVKGLPHFVQAQCRRCGAWLEELPQTSTQIRPGWWRFTWVCVRCRFRHQDRFTDPLETFRPDPTATMDTPGSVPPWTDWRLPALIITGIHSVADAYALPTGREQLEEFQSVPDHTGLRQTPWGDFEGDRDDPLGVRICVARLRHARSDRLGATLACLLAERAVLSAGAVFDELRRAQPKLAALAGFGPPRGSELGWIFDVPPVSNDDVTAGVRVGPVIGWGRLSIPSRYEDWLIAYGAYPWRSHRYDDLPRRADVPDGCETLADAIELADTLLLSFELFANADSF